MTAPDKLSQLITLGRALVSRVDVGLLVILALPYVLLSTGANWIFDYVLEGPYIDAWIYLGFFLDLPTHLKLFPATYYGSRLSWILPGYVAYKILPPIIAAYVLHLGLYYAAVLSLYLTLKITVSQRTALLSAVLMGCYGYFVWAVGWDYIDGAGIAYFLLTTLALTYAARSRRPWPWLILSGALYGALIYSQIFLVVFSPSLLFYYFAANREQHRHSRGLGSLFFAFGFLGISVLLGATNHKLGGDFLFYTPSVRAAMGFAPNAWKWPLQMWWKQATWLILPSLVFCSSMIFLFVAWRGRLGRNSRFLSFLQLHFLICASILLLFELKGTPVLQYSYYANFLIPTMFLAVGAQLTPMTDRLSSRHFVLLICGAIIVPLLTYRFPGPGSQLTSWVVSHAPWLLLALAVTGMASLLLRGGPAKTLALSLPCFVFALVNITNSAYRSTDPSVSRLGFPAIIQSVQVVRSAEPRGEILFWYQLSEPMGRFYRSVASTYLWGYTLVNERFPSLEHGDDSYQFPGANTRLVVLSSEEDAFQKADSALRQIGLGAQFLAERRIQEGPIAWKILFIKVHAWPTIEDVRLTANAWPESVQLQSQSQERQVVSLLGQDIHHLFQSDMDSSADWEINRYSRSGGLSIQANCFAVDDSCGLYSYGDQRDHLASAFVTLPAADGTSVFFSIWVKPLAESANPKVVLQNERFLTVAQSQDLLSRQDGWILKGGWLDVRDARTIRLVVTQPPGSSSLLDKALLLYSSAEVSGNR